MNSNDPMEDIKPWFTFCLVGAVFALIITPATASVGFGLFALNAIALGFFVAPIVADARDAESATTPSHLQA